MFYDKNGIFFEYEVVYSNRKSIEIRIEPTGLVRLKVPKKTSSEVIEDVFQKKEKWIVEKIDQVLKTSLPKRTYGPSEKILYLGEPIPIKITRRSTSRGQISMVNNELILIVPEGCEHSWIKDLIVAFYKKLLKQLVLKRIDFYQKHFAYKVNQVSVRDQKTRWGSCSSTRNLNFNYRLMMAPPEVIDYIVVHEMCHLEHMNHSKSFWKKVYEVMPDYKKHELFLKEKGMLLNIDWKME